MHILSAGICIRWIQYPWRSEKSARFPGTEVTENCEPPSGCWESNKASGWTVSVLNHGAISPAPRVSFYKTCYLTALLPWTVFKEKQRSANKVIWKTVTALWSINVPNKMKAHFGLYELLEFSNLGFQLKYTCSPIPWLKWATYLYQCFSWSVYPWRWNLWLPQCYFLQSFNSYHHSTVCLFFTETSFH